MTPDISLCTLTLLRSHVPRTADRVGLQLSCFFNLTLNVEIWYAKCPGWSFRFSTERTTFLHCLEMSWDGGNWPCQCLVSERFRKMHLSTHCLFSNTFNSDIWIGWSEASNDRCYNWCKVVILWLIASAGRVEIMQETSAACSKCSICSGAADN